MSSLLHVGAAVGADDFPVVPVGMTGWAGAGFCMAPAGFLLGLKVCANQVLDIGLLLSLGLYVLP